MTDQYADRYLRLLANEDDDKLDALAKLQGASRSQYLEGIKLALERCSDRVVNHALRGLLAMNDSLTIEEGKALAVPLSSVVSQLDPANAEVAHKLLRSWPGDATIVSLPHLLADAKAFHLNPFDENANDPTETLLVVLQETARWASLRHQIAEALLDAGFDAKSTFEEFNERSDRDNAKAIRHSVALVDSELSEVARSRQHKGPEPRGPRRPATRP